jgi:hypothetical protein
LSRLNNKNLVVYKDTTNLSNILSVFKGVVNGTLLATSHIYIGYRKPIHTLYFDLQDGNTNTSIPVIEKWNGTAWEIIDRQDDTFGLSKSGFVFTDDFATEQKTTYQSKEMYWIRYSVIGDTTAISLRYINLVFSNLEDLTATDENIELYYPVDPTTNLDIKTFLNHQIGATEFILSKLNQAGKYKYNGIDISLLTQWDLNDINELRPAHKALVLAFVYRSKIDNQDGSDKVKYDIYMAEFNSQFDIFKGLLTIDSNDDGKIDTAEKQASISSSFRFNR